MYEINFQGHFCNASFDRPRRLTNHVKKAHPVNAQEQSILEKKMLTKPRAETRRAYKLSQKINAILTYFLFAHLGYFKAAACAVIECNIKSKGTFDPWLANREHLIKMYFTYPRFRNKKKIRIKRGRFHAQEEMLYMRFLYRRKVLKLPVSQH